MIVYRIAQAKYANDLFASGRANRWNISGDYVIYASTTRSLATLELLVHRSGFNMIGVDYKVMLINIHKKASIHTLDSKDLVKDWRNMRGYADTQEIGHSWVEKRKDLILKVPSAVIPQEYNFIINTEHPLFKEQIKLSKNEPYAFDNRLI